MFKKISICLFLLGIAAFGVVNSQRITLPLKRDFNQQFLVTVLYGRSQCQINLHPSVEYCSNIIAEPIVIVPGHCGSDFVGENIWNDGNDYIAPFQLGDTQADLQFTIPKPDSHYNDRQSLCFGTGSDSHNNNALRELFNEGKISSKVVYYYLTNSSEEYEEVGTLSIGEPIQQLSKKEFVELGKISKDPTFSAAGKDYVTIFGQRLASKSIVFISVDSPFTNLYYTAYETLLQLISKKGIQVTTVKTQYGQDIFLDSIDKLEPIVFPLVEADGVTIFNVTLTPTQYTRPQQFDGTFQLLINYVDYTTSIGIGNTILESYNIGFDQAKLRVLIAEKQEAQVRNFRGTQIKL